MVDPASGSTSQAPPTLSITVVPLNVVDDSMDGAQQQHRLDPDEDEDLTGLILTPLCEAGIVRASQSLYEDIVDDVILGVVFEEHRGAKLGLTALLEEGPVHGDVSQSLDFDVDETTRSSAGGGVDGDWADSQNQTHYGQSTAEILSSAAAALTKKPAECVCPNCQRNMAASRFAPHLEKCMGMGRNSSRLASRRIASSASRQADIASDDDVDDDDWSAGGADRQDHRVMSGDSSGKNRRRHLHKKDKNSPRRKKLKSSNGNGDGNSNSNTSNGSHSNPGLATGLAEGSGAASVPPDGQGGALEATTLTERLSNMCGVVSEHTGRMCTRSLRCPQHSDQQRRGVRAALMNPAGDHSLDGMLNDPSSVGLPPTGLTDKDKEIDVDTWEEGDSLASLLTAQSHDVSTPGAEGSPAESTSTTASSTSSSARRPSVPNKATTNKNKQKTQRGGDHVELKQGNGGITARGQV